MPLLVDPSRDKGVTQAQNSDVDQARAAEVGHYGQISVVGSEDEAEERQDDTSSFAFNIESFPCILDAILSYADTPTLARLSQTNKAIHGRACRLLYRIVDETVIAEAKEALVSRARQTSNDSDDSRAHLCTGYRYIRTVRCEEDLDESLDALIGSLRVLQNIPSSRCAITHLETIVTYNGSYPSVNEPFRSHSSKPYFDHAAVVLVAPEALEVIGDAWWEFVVQSRSDQVLSPARQLTIDLSLVRDEDDEPRTRILREKFAFPKLVLILSLGQSRSQHYIQARPEIEEDDWDDDRYDEMTRATRDRSGFEALVGTIQEFLLNQDDKLVDIVGFEHCKISATDFEKCMAEMYKFYVRMAGRGRRIRKTLPTMDSVAARMRFIPARDYLQTSEAYDIYSQNGVEEEIARLRAYERSIGHRKKALKEADTWLASIRSG